MALAVDFYTNKSDKRALTKNLTTITSVSAKVTEECNVLNPVLEVGLFTNFAKANYFYISEWGRYYFIDSMNVAEGGRIFIKGHVDVLSTYREEILACSAVVCRQQSKGNYYLNDPVYKARQYKISTVVEFPNTIFSEDGDMVLAVAGYQSSIGG